MSELETGTPEPARGDPADGAVRGGADGAGAGRAGAYRGVVVVFVAAATVPIGYLGNEGVSPLVALAGLLLLPLALAEFVRRPVAPPLGVVILLALTAWSVASFAWSPLKVQQLSNLRGYAHLQALTAPKLVAQFVLYGGFLQVALRLSPPWRRRALRALAGSVVLIAALLVVEGTEGGQIYERLSELVGQHWPPDLARRNAARGCYGAAVLFWPVADVLWRRSAGGVMALFAAAAVGSAMLGVDSPVLAMLTGLLAFAAVRQFGRAGVWACLLAVIVYFLAAPFPFLALGSRGVTLPDDVGKLSWHARLDSWRFAAQRIAEHPVLGWGLDASRAWPDQIPMHPHDAAIQLWLETGVPGVTLGALFFAWLFTRVSAVETRDRGAAATMAATVAAYLTIGAVSFGVWQEWWLALGVVAVAACAMAAQQRGEQAWGAQAWGEQAWGAHELQPLGLGSGDLQPLGPAGRQAQGRQAQGRQAQGRW